MGKSIRWILFFCMVLICFFVPIIKYDFGAGAEPKYVSVFSAFGTPSTLNKIFSFAVLYPFLGFVSMELGEVMPRYKTLISVINIVLSLAAVSILILLIVGIATSEELASIYMQTSYLIALLYFLLIFLVLGKSVLNIVKGRA